MQEFPLVSVIIPCYNDNEIFLRECITSIINQTYKNIELIAIDDGSTNRSSSANLEKLRDEFHFILERQENKGISAALNKGIVKYASGKYIAILGSDDIWELNKIELQVRYMEAAPSNVAACCTRGYYFFENNPAKPGSRLTHLLQPQHLTFESLLLRNCILQPSVMIRKDIFDDVGLFDENCRLEDWDMWLRITNKYIFGFLDKPLTHYRRHANNASNRDDMLYKMKKYTINKWRGRKGQKKSLNNIEIAGLNNFAKNNKSEALKIFLSNPQCANQWLYWRGFLKIFIPAFAYKK